MNDKVKNIVVSIVFVFSLVFFLVLSLLIQDEELSYSERRKLAQFPQITFKDIKDATFMNKLDTYVVDQFPFREEFRSIKANVHFNIFKQKDNNGIYVIGDNIFKIEYPYNQNSFDRAGKKFNDIYNLYFKDKDMNVYYSVIPDKNYFVAKQNGYPSIDYEDAIKTLNNRTENMEYIDILDCLELKDYYRTDTHWSQERIEKVVNKIATQMNFKDRLSNNYEIKEIPEFYGVYYGQSALDIKPESMKYLTNDIIEDAVVFDYEDNTSYNVYNFEKLNGMDKYDMFLSGARSLQKIDNPNATTDKELIVFRDSFGSSIVPLFIEGYKTITLIDLRYIPTNMLSQFIEFDNQDVLFLYSTLILNNSIMLK